MIVLITVFITAIIVLFTGVFNQGKYARYTGIAGLLLALALSFQPEPVFFEQYHSMYALSASAVLFSRIAIMTTLLIFFLGGFAFSNHRNHQSELYALMLFALCGGFVLFGFQNLITLFLGIEILSIPLYVLAGANKNDLRSNEASLKYFLMGAFATGFLLFGIAMIYGAAGSFDLAQIREFVTLHQSEPMLILGMIMMLSAFSFKVSLAPFHTWSPDVYQGAPTIITAFMASVVKTSAVYAFFVMMTQVFGSIMGSWQNIVGVLIILTFLIANTMGLAQSNAKRMLAFSSVSHAGYLALIFFGVNENSTNVLAFYLFAYSLSTIGVFMTMIYVEKIKRETSYNAFKGLAKTSPVLALVSTVSLLSMAGIPITAGFIAKFSLFAQAINGSIFLVLMAIIGSAISIAYYLRLIISMYFFQESSFKTSETVSITYNIVGVVIILTIIILGIFPDLFFHQFAYAPIIK